MVLAALLGHLSAVRTGPKDPAARRAGLLMSHLAGDLGVHMLASLNAAGNSSPQQRTIFPDDGRRRNSSRKSLQIHAACASTPCAAGRLQDHYPTERAQHPPRNRHDWGSVLSSSMN